MKRPMTTIKTQPKKRGNQLEAPAMPEVSNKAEGLAGLKPVNAAVNEPSGSEAVQRDKVPSRPRDPAKNLRGVSAKDGTTKAKIERAALHLFAEHGVDGVSTKQIAAAAGISEGAIYRHFSGKEELARSMMVSIHGRLTEMIAAADEAHETLDEKIKFIVRHYCRIADDDWELFQYHILHLHHFPKLADSPDDSPIGASARLLQTAMDKGEIDQVDPYILSAMALGVVLQAAQAKVFGYVTGPLAARTDLFTHRVLAVLNVHDEGA